MRFSKKASIFLASIFMVLVSTQIIAKPKKDWEASGGNIYLFADYFDNLDLNNFDPHKNPGNKVFLLVDERSFNIDLKNKKITVRAYGIASLPLPTSPLNFTLPTRMIIDLDGWHTVLFVESVSIVEKINGIKYVMGREIYTTVYGSKLGQSSESNYVLIQPRTKIS